MSFKTLKVKSLIKKLTIKNHKLLPQWDQEKLN